MSVAGVAQSASRMLPRAEHVELVEVAGGDAEIDRRLAAAEAVPQFVAVLVERIRPAEHGGGLELDQVGEPLGQVGLLPREEDLAHLVERRIGPADRPPVEQVLVEQLDRLGRPRKRRLDLRDLLRLGRLDAWPGTRPEATRREMLNTS